MNSNDCIIEIARAGKPAIRYTRCQIEVSGVLFRANRNHRQSSCWIIQKGLFPVGVPLVITTDPAGCLLLFRHDVWEPIKDKLLALPKSDPRFVAIMRLLIGNAREEQIDAQDRLPLAADLVSFAKLGKTACWVPFGNHAELWSAELYDAAEPASWLNRQRQAGHKQHNRLNDQSACGDHH